MRTKLLTGTGLALLAIASAGLTQVAIQPRMAPPAAGTLDTSLSPRLTGFEQGVRDENMRRNVTLERLDMDVIVQGGTAIVETTMKVSADGNRVEARLAIPMPEGAVVTGYALDVGGTLIEGSLVDQPKAQESFDSLVRVQVDPGLAEINRDNEFTTRIFPVDASGRTIRLRYVVPLGDALAIPLKLAPSAGNWTISVAGASGGVQLGNRSLDRAGQRLRAEGKGALDATLSIAPSDNAVLGSRHRSGEIYWQLAGELPRQRSQRGGSVKILWDRSRSGKDRDSDKALSTIADALEALNPSRIDFVSFNATSKRDVQVRRIEDVRRLAQDMRYGGATSFAGLAGERADICLLVSDGQVTLGEARSAAPDCRIFAIAPEGGDLPVLGALADRTGGAIVAAGANTDWTAPGIAAVTIDGEARDFIRLPARDGRFRLIAKGTAGDRAATVSLGNTARTFALSMAPHDYPGDAQLFARREASLLEQGGNRDAFLKHSRRYNIASPTLPFLVLESVEDYIRFDVEPERTHPDFTRWQRLDQQAKARAAEDKEDRLAQIKTVWAQEVAWWQKSFDPVAPGSLGRERRNGKFGPPPPAPPPPPVAAPPPPPPMPTAVREPVIQTAPAREEEAANIIVTGSRVSTDAAEAQLSTFDVQDTAPPPRTGIDIAVDAWSHDREYLAAYDAAPANFEASFRTWEDKVGNVPAFYLDSADWLWRNDRRDLAIETLMSALDLKLANSATLGIVADRLERWGRLDLAIDLRRRHAAQAAHRPQPSRLLALALAKRAAAQPATSRADLEEAIGLLTQIALTPVDPRWNGIDVIALREANALIPRLEALGGTVNLDPALKKNLDADIRIVMHWSADAVDLDLHVAEPSGELVDYGNRLSAIGGRMSNDMQQGFGPEEYWIRRAPGGRFTVSSNLFASDRIDPNGSARLSATLIRDFGRPGQAEEEVDIEMSRDASGRVEIGTIRLRPAR